MPTYEYACNACDEHLEAVQSFTDEPLRTCPTCGGELRKVFGAVGIVLKGSGFYKTDSRSASKAARSGAAKGGGDAGGEVKSTGSSESSSNSADSSSSSSNGKSTDSSPSKADSSPSKAATSS